MSKMILIIEDEESIQNIIKAFLEDAGYTVVLAADGLEGIEQFRVRFCGGRAGFPSSCSPHWMMKIAR